MPKLPGSKAGKGVEPWVRFLKKGVVLDQPVRPDVKIVLANHAKTILVPGPYYCQLSILG